VLRALERIDHRALEIDVVVGGGSPFVDEIREQAARHPHRVRVEQDLEDLVDVMLAADACVCAGGSTVWELCCLGVPMAWLTVADNQRSIVAELERRGCGISLGEAASCAPASLTGPLEDWVEGRGGRLAAQADAAWQLVDGRGAERVATRMQQTSLGNATS
jgi:spore coat polysaccharide biosynthesis predicted glycosyltransferase SpsG